MRIYVAGPMTGLPEFNYPAFHSAAELLRDHGYQVVNPADTAVPDGSPWRAYMNDCIPKLLTCEAVALLPDWHTSRGARLEKTIADRLEIPARRWTYWLSQPLNGDPR